jgi:hypothetical protein
MTVSCNEIRFGQRYCGPPGFANGGFACGSIAALAGGTAEVTLRRPLPLERQLPVSLGDPGKVLVHYGDLLLAETRPAAPPELAAPPVSLEQARTVERRDAYFDDPLFPGCFGCGIDRGPGDGLRIFPGQVPGQEVWAAPWTPDSSVADAEGRVSPEVAWAALDCPSGIAAAGAGALPPGTSILLGRMTATVARLPRAGEDCWVVAWPGRRDGRKLEAGSALAGPGGEVLAAARTLWVTVPGQASAGAGTSTSAGARKQS